MELQPLPASECMEPIGGWQQALAGFGPQCLGSIGPKLREGRMPTVQDGTTKAGFLNIHSVGVIKKWGRRRQEMSIKKVESVMDVFNVV